MWCSAPGIFFFFCMFLVFVQHRWGNTGGQPLNVDHSYSLIKTQCAPWPWQTTVAVFRNLSLNGVPITNAKCWVFWVFFSSRDKANLDLLNETKIKTDNAWVNMLSNKTLTGVIIWTTSQTLRWRLCKLNIKLSKWMIGFINMNISLASQCVYINGAGALETPPNVSWFMAEAITSCQCTDAWWANRCR